MCNHNITCPQFFGTLVDMNKRLNDLQVDFSIVIHSRVLNILVNILVVNILVKTAYSQYFQEEQDYMVEQLSKR